MQYTSTEGWVVWRMPNQSEIFYLSSSENGTDKFVIMPFENNATGVILKGNTVPISISAIPDVSNMLSSYNGSETDEETYKEWVEKSVASIKAGEVQKVVIARQKFIASNINPIDVFSKLTNDIQAFVYLYCLNNGDIMIGASPEKLVVQNNKSIAIDALGGTKQAYGYSKKEYVEHQQIVGYIENVLKAQNIEYSQYPSVSLKAGRVEHLHTKFSASKPSFDNILKIVNALHPTPAVCGFPLNKAYKLITQIEDFDRKKYAGYLGILNEGNIQLFVNLRCAEVYKNGYLLYAGAGLNELSVAEDEWRETEMKMQTISQFL